MIPVIEETFVKKYKLLTSEDIINMISITQTVPGLIAINSAVFAGRKLAGTRGSFAATCGVVLPSFIIIIIIAKFFPLLDITNIHILKAFSCIRACVLGIFVVLAYKIFMSIFKSVWDLLLLFALLSLLFFKFNPVVIVLICCVLGGLYEKYCRFGEKQK